MKKPPKKIWATFPMLNFSRWTPTLGVCFKWDSQKVLKIAHFGVFRHIGGTWGVQKHMYLKIYWVKVISSKNGDFWTPQCWEINFFRQNIGMFDWLYTETYIISSWRKNPNIAADVPLCLLQVQAVWERGVGYYWSQKKMQVNMFKMQVNWQDHV